MRKPGAPTIAELAAAVGLRPDPSAAAKNDGEDAQATEKEEEAQIIMDVVKDLKGLRVLTTEESPLDFYNEAKFY